jgi:glucose-1-phosphate thymidylyltransferase
MAGRGSRLRPHTLTVPKPLIPIAGKPIVRRLVEDIAELSHETVDEIAFVIGDFGDEVERDLLRIAEELGAKGSIYYQDQPLGTAHAILCAADSLTGDLVVAFADTLFRADFEMDKSCDGTIWVKQVDDPSAFGVVKMDAKGVITDFVEKPSEFVSDLAIIGIYYFRDGENLKSELQYLIDNDIRDKGEYQLTNALENMKEKGLRFLPGEVKDWMDCGNKDVTVETNTRVLSFIEEDLVHESVQLNNSSIIPPCYIGPNVVLRNSTIGPNVSIGEGSKIESCTIKNSIIQTDSQLVEMDLDNSMVGNHVRLRGSFRSISIGDYCTSE